VTVSSAGGRSRCGGRPSTFKDVAQPALNRDQPLAAFQVRRRALGGMSWHHIPKDDVWKQAHLAMLVRLGKPAWLHCDDCQQHHDRAAGALPPRTSARDDLVAVCCAGKSSRSRRARAISSFAAKCRYHASKCCVRVVAHGRLIIAVANRMHVVRRRDRHQSVHGYCGQRLHG